MTFTAGKAGRDTRSVRGLVWLAALLAFCGVAQAADASPAKGSMWDEHPRVIAGISFAVLCQSLMITALLVQRRRRQLAEDEVRLGNERYREVVETQHEMVCRYLPDSTCTFVNDAFCRHFGKPREEIVGAAFLEMLPKEQHRMAKEGLRKMIETQQPYPHEHTIEIDGKEIRMEWVDYPVIDEKGVIKEFQSIGRDITRRWHAQEALRQSEERFSGVFRGSPAAIGIIRQSDGRLVDVNPSWERFFEIGRDQAIGSTPVELGLIASREAGERFKIFLESGESLNGFEQPVNLPGGKLRWMSMTCVLIPLGGEPCFVVMSSDITVQREMDEARQSLVQATRLAILGELTASISHEVNQPLGAILNNAETAEILLKSDTPSLAELRQILADIRRDDIRASEVIKRVRTLVGKHEMQMAPLYLNELLGDAIRMVEHDCQRHGVSITSEYALNLPMISGDRVQIEQVMLNLLLNAMDALKGVPLSNRRLIVRSARHGGMWVETSVEDNGHGMSPAARERIFDSFYTTKEQGMGLGLALARSIAEAHGGRLTAENNAGGGATFRLMLPVHDE
ncbi:PAS domain S-box protein [Luteolibacter sp. Populi]|uniref:PAS domain-containing sensor histidine kinase n=1 Tax=Luteolibacter sp. Populi TaxID=3230487 RepID=UPI003465CCAF